MLGHKDKIHYSPNRGTDSRQAGGENAIWLNDNRHSAVVQKKQADAIAAYVPKQRKVNNTGLPDRLKSGIESLSGHSMDDVKVHYNSAKPTQLNAHAYAQGTDIHLAPGQEKHLPHEAWHVVQQKQGRVRPTMQMKGKVNINDDKGLEKEADVMGARALTGQLKTAKRKANCVQNVAQLRLARLQSAGSPTDRVHVYRFGGDNNQVGELKNGDMIEVQDPGGHNNVNVNPRYGLKHDVPSLHQIIPPSTHKVRRLLGIGPGFTLGNLWINGQRLQWVPANIATHGQIDRDETVNSLGAIYNLAYNANGRARPMTQNLQNAIYNSLGKSPKANYIAAPADTDAFVGNADLLHGRFLPQNAPDDFFQRDLAQQDLLRRHGVQNGDYFHFFNPHAAVAASTDRIIVNISTQQEAIAIARDITNGWANPLPGNWRDSIQTFKIYVSNSHAEQNNPNQKLKNDKMVVYFAETNVGNKQTMNNIKNGINLLMPAMVNNAPLSSFYNRLTPQIGVGKEIAGTSFTTERSDDIISYINAHRNAPSRDKWIAKAYSRVLKKVFPA